MRTDTQDAEHMRAVQGLIFFGYNRLDPQTPPWTRVVQSFVLRDMLDALEQESPGHPLTAVFKPLVIDREEVLGSRSCC